MTISLVESALAAAHLHGRALLKFLSANDCGLTGSHQCGMYLPKRVWPIFSPFAPRSGRLDKSDARINWQDGERQTDSVVTWYGQGTRSEYRLTRFGRGFPYLREKHVGDLLVLVPVNVGEFLAFVLDSSEDARDVQAALGVEVIDGWGLFDPSNSPNEDQEDDCVARQLRRFAQAVSSFPTGDDFSAAARGALLHCVRDFQRCTADQQLMKLVRTEYGLFRIVEDQLCRSEVCGPFNTIDAFLAAASSVMNRRKSRAGRSMENHVGYLLREAKVPFDPRPKIEGEPDVLIPSKAAYDNGAYPASQLFMLGVKTTCKDRWRQVTREAPRIETKHLITLQEGISEGQVTEMRKQGVVLVVPKNLHVHYPPAARQHLLDFESFIRVVQRVHPRRD